MNHSVIYSEFKEIIDANSYSTEKMHIFYEVLSKVSDEKILMEYLNTLQNILRHEDILNLEYYFEIGFVHLFAKLINSNDKRIVLFATECMVNLTLADHNYIVYMVDCGEIDAFLSDFAKKSLIICEQAIMTTLRKRP